MRPAYQNTLAGSPLDRVGHRRKDPAWLAAQLNAPETQLAVFVGCAPVLAPDLTAPLWLAGHARDAVFGPAAPTLFLGLDPAGRPHFAVEAPARFDFEASPIAGLGAVGDMRAAAGALPAGDAAMLGAAKGLFEWHARHGFCAACGAGTDLVEAGWKRQCPACGAEHFPRVDPVAIMLPVVGERCLLGRQARFPPGLWSALAGFIEPGESIEEGCARETYEEAGLRVLATRYHSSQPWPFPSSLMIGLIAEVADDTETIDLQELEAGRWFTRAEAQAMLAGRHPDAVIPPPLAIAHHLIKAWADGG